MPLPEIATVNDRGELDLHFHTGQIKAWDSRKRFVLVSAGSGGGKTSFGAFWLWREIQLCGPGDYLAVSPSYPLMNKKMLPEFLKLFEDRLRLGEYRSADRMFEFTADGVRRCFTAARPEDEVKVFFGHADDPESLESAVAKAAWLDEAGQKRFRLGSWEAINRRVAINKGRILLTSTPYCYDETTEVYTRDGWKSFGALTPDDEVLACTPQGESHFEKPKAVVWQRYDGPMVRLKGGRVDLLITPNHRVAYKNGRHWYVRTAEEFVRLKYQSYAIPKAVAVTGGRENFILPAVDRGHRWGPRSGDPLRIPMADWCAFLGWYLAEGSCRGTRGGKVKRHSYRVSVAQKSGLKRDMMREDLKKLPFNWHEDKTGFRCSNKQLWHYLFRLGNSDAKYIPAEMKGAGAANLKILIDRMVRGDGTYRNDRHGEFLYFTVSERLAKDFQEVCMLAGIPTLISKRANGAGNIGGRPVSGRGYIYHIAERRRKRASVKSHEVVGYSGMIGCVSVSTGFVLVRRNGEEVVCGNTWGWMKSKLYDPWEEARKARRDHPEIDVVQFDSTENPNYPPSEYARAMRELPRWRFDMQYRGRFTRPAGMIYDCFERPVHLVPRFAVPPEWPRYWGMDFGAVNCACVKFAQDPQTKRFYAYQSYWPGSRRTEREHVDALLAGDSRPLRVIGGSRSENDWRNRFALAGLSIDPTLQTDVEAGIQTVWTLLSSGRLFVFKDLEDLADEFEQYSRVVDESGEPTAEIEDKDSWHRLDAVRYACSYFGNRSDAKVDPPVMPKRNEMTPGQILQPKIDLARKKGLFGLR